jgi:SsrA-binding protein
MAPSGVKVVASNRRARHDYAILETLEAGLVLRGGEVKSLRAGHVQLADAYAYVKGRDCWLEGVHIAPYAFSTGFDAPDPDRARKVLMHASEIEELGQRVARERLTLVPLSIYFRDGRAKVELGLARGRRKGDQRQAMAERDAARDMAKALGRQRKGMD